MKLEENQLIQALVTLKWITKEAIPLLSAKMYENEKSIVGKLRAYGLSSEAILEGAMFANIESESPLLVVDLSALDFAKIVAVGTPLTLSLMKDYFVAPIGIIDNRLKVAVADIDTKDLLKQIHFPAPVDYWLADSQQIQTLITQIAGMRERVEKVTDIDSQSSKEEVSPTERGQKISAREKEESSDEVDIMTDAVTDVRQGQQGHLTTSSEMSSQLYSISKSVPLESVADIEPDPTVGMVLGEEYVAEIAPSDMPQSGALLTATSQLSSQIPSQYIENNTDIEDNFTTIDVTNVATEQQRAHKIEVDDLAQLSADDLVGYLNFILLDAVTQKASDIHFEPYESLYRIRFRIDGVLREVYQVPEKYRERITARLKVMAELDIAEKRLPQDGHLTLQLDEDDANGESVDARISVIPTIWGEKVVLRLLDSNEVALTLNQLGLSNHDRPVVQAAIERSQGLILVTGPTGSGKTVTLYAALNALNQASRNIATIEDPVEINLEGINQLQVHPEIGLDFAEALRAFLRQDPDVVMVGEIRDYKTADIVIKAAQTGHLVLSTLHTNSAIETLNRLKNMGIELYNIASTVKLIIAQRLVRVLCHCKEEDIVDSHYLESLGFTSKQAASRFFKAKGCRECRDGYKGRRAIFEVMPISKQMASLILEDAGSIEIQRQAEREGIKTLRQAGIEMVLEGITSLEEVLRVTYE